MLFYISTFAVFLPNILFCRCPFLVLEPSHSYPLCISSVIRPLHHCSLCSFSLDIKAIFSSLQGIDILFFWIHSLQIIVLDAGVVHLVYLLDRAVKTRRPLSDQYWHTSGSPWLNDRVLIQQVSTTGCIHVVHKLGLQTVFISKIPSCEWMIIQHICDEAPIVSEDRNIPSHKCYFAVIENHLNLLLIIIFSLVFICLLITLVDLLLELFHRLG